MARHIFIFVLLPMAGCCLDVAGLSGKTLDVETSGSAATTGVSDGIGSTGRPATNSRATGGATTGGSSSGGGSTSWGGATTGATVNDGGCHIDGGVVAAGTWLDLDYGSCTVCDPSVDPSGWTQLAEGSSCEGFTTEGDYPSNPHNGRDKPFEGHCVPSSTWSTCSCIIAGGHCAGRPQGCCGGFCNDDGQCTLTQNLGWPTACGHGISESANPCASGPCCPDAGFEGFQDGGGWCCGLIDGGEPSCLGSESACYRSSDCCGGLTCAGLAPIYEDAGLSYGLCE